MKSLLAIALFCVAIVSASAVGVEDYVATYKGSGTVNHLGTVYPTAVTLKVRKNGTVVMEQTFTWSLGPITHSFSGFVSAVGDIVLKTPSGDKVVGGKINGKLTGAKVTGIFMSFGEDPRTFRLERY